MCGCSWLLVPTLICCHCLSIALSAARIYAMRSLGLCWTLIHRVTERISLLCRAVSLAISYFHRTHMAIHSPSNEVHTSRKQDCAVNAPMRKKPLASVGSGNRSPGPWAKRCYTKQASVQEDDPRCAKVRNRDASSKTSKVNITTCYPQPPSPRSRLPFTTEDQLYLHHRLPLQKPTTAKIARLHFAHLAFVYQDLADRSLARASMMTPGPARERRQRMGVLAARLAKRYRGCKIVLSDQFIKTVISRHAGSIERRSHFWETVLDEVEVQPLFNIPLKLRN